MQVVAWLLLLFVTLRSPLPTGNVSTTLEHPVEVELASELHGVLGEVVSESSRDVQKLLAFTSPRIREVNSGGRTTAPCPLTPCRGPQKLLNSLLWLGAPSLPC